MLQKATQKVEATMKAHALVKQEPRRGRNVKKNSPRVPGYTNQLWKKHGFRRKIIYK